MPVVHVDKEEFYKALGKEYCKLFLWLENINWNFSTKIKYIDVIINFKSFTLATDEFSELCFDLGLELEEDVCLFLLCWIIINIAKNCDNACRWPKLDLWKRAGYQRNRYNQGWGFIRKTYLEDWNSRQ